MKLTTHDAESKDEDLYKRGSMRRLEQQRRNRMNELMQTLESLAFPERDLTSKRVTKEEILKRVISLISKPKEEKVPKFEHLKEESNEEDDKSVGNPVFGSIKDSECSLKQSEIEVAFRVLFLRGMDKFLSTLDKEYHITFLEELTEIAKTSNRIDLQIQVAIMMQKFYTYGQFCPLESEKQLQIIFDLYKHIANPTELLTFFEGEIECFILSRKALAYASTGKFEMAVNLWNESQLLKPLELMEPRHRQNYMTAHLEMQLALNEPLSPKIAELARTITHPLRSFSDFYLGMYELEHNNFEEAVYRIIRGRDILSLLLGAPVCDSHLGPFIMQACLKIGAYDEGIELGERLMGQSISGFLGPMERLRLYAELLMAKCKTQNQITQSILQHINKLLQDSISGSVKVSAHTCYLRAAISYANFVLSFGKFLHNFKQTVIDSLSVLHRALSLVDQSPTFSLTRKGYSLIDQLVSIQSKGYIPPQDQPFIPPTPPSNARKLIETKQHKEAIALDILKQLDFTQPPKDSTWVEDKLNEIIQSKNICLEERENQDDDITWEEELLSCV